MPPSRNKIWTPQFLAQIERFFKMELRILKLPSYTVNQAQFHLDSSKPLFIPQVLIEVQTLREGFPGFGEIRHDGFTRPML